MISEAQIVEIKAFIWNEGEKASAFQWEGKPDYESVHRGLCDVLNDGVEFGKLVVLYPMSQNHFELYLRAFDDEHRGRQIIAGISPEDLDRSFIAHRKFCAQKVFTPKELYALTPVQISKVLYHFISVHMREEIDSFDADFHSMEASGEIEIHKLVNVCPDGRRTWTLETVWFKSEPVMVVNSSGRDGDEYHSRWITNLPQFVEMVKYMKEFTKSWEVEGLISEDTVIPAMTEFYNGTIHDYYDVEKQVTKS